MSSKADLFDNYETWGAVFFNAKNTEHAEISSSFQDELLNYFNKEVPRFLTVFIGDLFSNPVKSEQSTSEDYKQTTLKGGKYIRFPKYRVEILGKSFLIAFRINICRKLNIIKIFYYLQSEGSLEKSKILLISKETKQKIKSIANNIQQSILNDDLIKKLFHNKIKRDVFDLYICNLNTLDDTLKKDIKKLVADFDEELIRNNDKIQHVVMFLYNLNEDRTIDSLAELREEVIVNYTDNQFTTAETNGLKGFYVYYINNIQRTEIVYSGIAPYKDQKSMHALNRRIAIAYAENT